MNSAEVKRLALLLAPLALTALWATSQLVIAQSQPEQPEASSKAIGEIKGKKFDHALHADKDKMPRIVVGGDNCKDCHGGDTKGKLALPGAVSHNPALEAPICDPNRAKLAQAGQAGHQPCLEADCHVNDFLGTGASTKQTDPVRYRRAAAFCIGCHGGSEPPVSSAQVPARNIYCNNPEPSYHIEMNHYDHTQEGSCRSCHVVDGKTFQLVGGRPSHDECAGCHEGKQASPMTYCQSCHRQPGANQYFSQKRDKLTVVRSCGSDAHLAVAARRNKSPDQVPCFKHETKHHRFKKNGPIQCGQCHYRLQSDKTWNKKFRYQKLKEIKVAPVIDDDDDRAHEACGDSRACHKRHVDDMSSGAKCTLCHEDQY